MIKITLDKSNTLSVGSIYEVALRRTEGVNASYSHNGLRLLGYLDGVIWFEDTLDGNARRGFKPNEIVAIAYRG